MTSNQFAALLNDKGWRFLMDGNLYCPTCVKRFEAEKWGIVPELISEEAANARQLRDGFAATCSTLCCWNQVVVE